MLSAGAALEISYIKLTPEEEALRLDLEVRATFATTFTDHGARRRAD
jgi:hypothetical protein